MPSTLEHEDFGPDADSSGQLLSEIVCPNCWHRCPPEDLLFIARHSALVGDPVVGDAAYQRFLPTRFTISGNAIDPRGMECQDLACPRCHLKISRPLIEMPPIFLSTVGAPASGKSYYLAAMTWQMRRQTAQLGISYADGDPESNSQLQRYEETLFLNADQKTPVEIRKTEAATGESELYQSITLDGQRQAFPRPFVFTLNPTPGNPLHGTGRFPHHALVLYDNAGEHFLPNSDSAEEPVTLHLARSGAILFLFDPTQDPRFRNQCSSDDPQLRHGLRPDGSAEQTLMRQEVVLNEVASRVRKYRGLGQNERHKRPLIMVLAKADVWLNELTGETIDEEPLTGDDPPRLDLNRVEQMSMACRKAMQWVCPEVVAAAEGFSKHVVYVPVSSLGTSPELVEDSKRRYYGVRPRNIQPRWVTVPMLWALAKGLPDLIPAARPKN